MESKMRAWLKSAVCFYFVSHIAGAVGQKSLLPAGLSSGYSAKPLYDSFCPAGTVAVCPGLLTAPTSCSALGTGYSEIKTGIVEALLAAQCCCYGGSNPQAQSSSSSNGSPAGSPQGSLSQTEASFSPNSAPAGTPQEGNLQTQPSSSPNGSPAGSPQAIVSSAPVQGPLSSVQAPVSPGPAPGANAPAPVPGCSQGGNTTLAVGTISGTPTAAGRCPEGSYVNRVQVNAYPSSPEVPCVVIMYCNDPTNFGISVGGSYGCGQTDPGPVLITSAAGFNTVSGSTGNNEITSLSITSKSDSSQTSSGGQETSEDVPFILSADTNEYVVGFNGYQTGASGAFTQLSVVYECFSSQ